MYKVVGPVLMKVDLGDAKDNVEKRLDFIKGAMYVPSVGRLYLSPSCSHRS